MDISMLISRCTGFQWDGTNLFPAGRLSGVSPGECEQVFFNRSLFAETGEECPDAKRRFLALGRTDAGRFLKITFELKTELIRIITAHDMSGRERKAFSR